jgi:diguanylate cyclase (GGDEF)-like protein/PAS domain S-box-containing protein
MTPVLPGGPGAHNPTQVSPSSADGNQVTGPAGWRGRSWKLGLLILVALVTLPTLGVVLVGDLSRQAVDARARDGLTQTAAVLASEITQAYQQRESLLHDLPRVPNLDLALRSGDPSGLDLALSEVLADSPYCSLTVASPGRAPVYVRSSGRCWAPGPVSTNPDQPRFLAVGVTGGQAFAAVRLAGAVPGSPGTELEAVFPVRGLTGAMKAATTSPSSSSTEATTYASLINRTTVVASSLPDRVGEAVTSAGVLAQIRAGRASTRSIWSPRLHEGLIDAYRPVPGTAMSVVVSLPTSVAYAGAHRLSNDLGLGYVMFLLVALATSAGVTEIVDRREKAVEGANARFAALVEHGSDLVAILDADCAIRFASPAFAHVLGWSPDEVLGHPLDRYIHIDLRGLAVDALRPVMATPGTFGTFDCEATDREGRRHDLELHATNRLDDPDVAGLVINCRDVTERVLAADRLTHLANHDSLTGLPNRSLLLDRLTQALAQAERSRRPVAVLFVDLDHFKHINDSLGHGAGDRALVTLAGRLTGSVRPGDTVARIGGDEFVIVTVGASDPAGVALLADRVQEVIAQPFELDDQTVAIGASVGVAFSTPGQHAEALIQQADTAMYRAKDRGRGRSEVYEDAMKGDARRQLSTETRLRSALDGGMADGVVVQYQPIVDLRSRAVVGSEALLRLRAEDGRIIPPGEFIGVAERSGLIVPLGDRILDMACEQQAAWDRAGRAMRSVSVNLSAHQLESRTFAHQVMETLARHRLPASQLCVELTESTLVGSGPCAQDNLVDLKALGVTIALDDFGTGWSSLTNLRRFPVDVLKIDRSFVAGLGIVDDDTEVVRATIGLGHALRLTVVAEGVETEAQAELLRELDCDRAQGWLFGRPQHPDDLLPPPDLTPPVDVTLTAGTPPAPVG